MNDFKGIFPRWGELPSFELYSEQMTSLVEDYLRPLLGEGEPILTSSMIITM